MNLLRTSSLILILCCCFFMELQAQVKWLRATYRDDPATTIALGWSGVVGTVYYDTIDHGANYALYTNNKTTDRSTSHKGESHFFARLTNLQAGTVYYFVIRYGANNSSARYSFRTLSDNSNDPISFISGGDSRKRLSFLGIGDPSCWGNGCRETRQDLNTIVARVRPDFVAFTGDYIRNFDIPFTVDSEDDWEDWMNDWDRSIGPDGRITPIIHSLGNHEDAVDLDRMFDVPNTDIYYATNFGGDLFRLYTLNSEPSDVCADVIQKNWLINDLQQHSTASNTPYWKIAQYHRPMIPHAEYTPRTDLINCWASEFAQYGVRLVAESHAHVLKTTYPLIYDNTAPNSYNGLVRDDSLGAVFIGDGSWGAPPRTAYAPIAGVTQDVEQISGAFFVNINRSRIQIKGIIPYRDSLPNVPQLLDDDQGTLLPAGTPLWRPPNGSACITIPNYNPLITGVSSASILKKYRSTIGPNPAKDYINVTYKSSNTESIRIELYDARGKSCPIRLADNPNDNTARSNEVVRVVVEDLRPGVYFINIITAKDIEAHKVIIAR